KNNIPDFVLTNHTRGSLFNLNDYFQDPDLDKLNYSLLFFDEFENQINQSSKLYDINIKNNGDLEIYPKVNLYLKEFFKIKAQDYLGLSAYSNLFYFKLASSENITQIFINSTKKEQCKVQIECSEWSLCLPTNIKTRECYDVNNCNGENKIITETEQCDYNATCFDNIKNQDETDVDCGGPCKACPTCNDGLLNQNEEKTDCGGPCGPCPTCFDNIKNQDETDVDCGGSCNSCESEKKCLNHKDCISFNCINNICAYPTCSDNKLNQGEEKTDCGGPCFPCPTCNDGLLNQNEEKTDCGGPCPSCENCFDGIKNQDEIFVDCGNSCESCFLLDSLNFFKKNYYVFFIFFIGFIFYLHFLNLYNKDKINNLSKYSKFLSFMPAKIENKEIFEKTIINLEDLKKEIINLNEKDEIKKKFLKIFDEFYQELLNIEGNFTEQELKRVLSKKIFNPFLRQLLIEFYHDSKNITTESPFFRIEMNEKIKQSINILNKIRELI
ncbi:MAG: hypothetical protein QXR96_03810, partial [Candidatus Woesearchaeota archaeon]